MGLIKVLSLRYHTYDDVARPEGTVYEADEQYLETLEAIGMVRRAVGAAPPTPAAPPPARKPTR